MTAVPPPASKPTADPVAATPIAPDLAADGTEGPPGALPRRFWMLLAGGLLATVLLAEWQHRHNHSLVMHRLDEAAEAQVTRLQQRMQRYEYGLRGARGAIVTAGTDRITAADFERYHATRDLPLEFPGAHGFGFIRRVPAGGEAQMMARAIGEGRADFRIHAIESAPDDGQRPRYVIEYIEPLAANRAAVGLDIASERHRRQAAERAMHTGQATLTAPLTLVQAQGQQGRGFLVLLPVYRDGAAQATAAEREQALVGWAYAPLLYDEVTRGNLRPAAQLSITVSDLSADAQAEPFYQGPGLAEARRIGLQLSLVRPIFGRNWRYTVHAGPDFVPSLRLVSPWAVVALGLLTTLLAAGWMRQRHLSRQRAAQVAAARLRLAEVVEHASDAIITESLDGRVTGWNRAAEQIFGWPMEAALGQPLERLIGDPDAEPGTGSAEILSLAGQGRRLLPFDAVRRRRDGSRVELSIAASPIFDAAGRIVGVGKSLRDVSQRRQLERRLQALTGSLEQQVRERTAQLEAAHRDLALILDALPSMVAYWQEREERQERQEREQREERKDRPAGSAELVQRFANRTASNWFGAAAANAGEPLAQALGPALFAELKPAIDAALAGSSQRFMRVLPPADAAAMPAPRQLLWHLLPDTVGGQTRGLYVLAYDVTELAESQRALAASEAVLERAGQVARVGGWQLDLASQQVTWTRQTLLIHEVAPDHQPGYEEALAFYLPEARETLRALVDAAVHRGEPWDVELPMVTARGRSIWVRTVGQVEFEGEGAERRAVRLVGAVQDITARRQADEAVRQLRAAEAASAAKSTFLANVSHEMRTPLNAITGFLHLLERTELDADQRHHLQRAQKASRALLATINDVLDLSRLDAGQMRIVREPVALRTLMAELLDWMRPLAEEKRLSLVFEGVAELPAWVATDGLRLRQVLTNLLANAIKFTESGSVRVRAGLLVDGGTGAPQPAGWPAPPGDDSPGPARLQVVVEDTGIGIDGATLKRLFRPFSQADDSTTRRFGGSGLGLSIVQRLLVMMDGDIAVDSRPGVGSRFTVLLPVQVLPPDRAPPPPQPAALREQRLGLPGLRVLVVDDSEDNREVAARLLADEGARVELAEGGASALAALQAAALPFDAVVMDIQMPDLDGTEVTRRLRADARFKALPVIGLSAGSMHADRARALAAGFDDYVAKPLVPEELTGTLRQALEAARGKAWPTAPRGLPAVTRLAGPMPGQPGQPALHGMDFGPALQRLQGDRALLGRLLDRLCGERPQWAGIDQALADGSLAPITLARRLHRLRGSAAMVGATPLVQAARAVEHALAELAPEPDVLTGLRALQGAFDGLVAAAAAWPRDGDAGVMADGLSAGLSAGLVAGVSAGLPAGPVAAPGASPSDGRSERPSGLGPEGLPDPPDRGPGGLPAHTPQGAQPADGAGERPDAEVAALAEQLRRRDLAARASFGRLKPRLQALWPPGRLARMEQALDALAFDEAQALLAAFPQPDAATPSAAEAG